MATRDTAPDTAQRYERFESLSEVRAAHDRLLNAVSDEGLGPGDQELILSFLGRAAATGEILESPADRRQAQGLLDYWVATLYSQPRPLREPNSTAATETQAAIRVPDRSSILADFSDAALVQIVADANAWLQTLGDEDRSQVFKILLQLARLSPDRKSFVPASSTLESLTRATSAPLEKMQSLVRRLSVLGIVNLENEGLPEERVSLRFPSLLRGSLWPELQKHLKRRVSFHEQVSGWAQDGYAAVKLLTGEVLDEVRGYRDLDAIELEFISRSRLQELANSRFYRGLLVQLGVLLAVMSIGMCITGYYYLQAKAEREKAKENEASAVKARMDAEKQREVAVKAREDAEKQKEIALAEKQNAEDAAKLAREERDKALEAKAGEKNQSLLVEKLRLNAQMLLADPEVQAAAEKTQPKAFENINELIPKKEVVSNWISDATGYKPLFLEIDDPLPLPALSEALKTKAFEGGKPLDYFHYSLCFHRERRTAIYTACNFERTGEPPPPRGRDSFYFEQRVPAELQLGLDLYLNNNFDRGHYVSRLDIAWGASEKDDWSAFLGAHVNVYTNVVPQYDRFNQRLWHDIEDWARRHHNPAAKRVCIFTGPVLGPDDYEFQGVRIPRSFWKIVCSRRSAQSQELVVDAFLAHQYATTNPEQPLESNWSPQAQISGSSVERYREQVSEIEKLTGLSFSPLLHTGAQSPSAASKR